MLAGGRENIFSAAGRLIRLRGFVAQSIDLSPAGEHKGRSDPVDQQTKAALKNDKFVTTTSHGLEWASENRRSVITTTAILLAVILVVVLSAVIYNSRSDAASVAFGAAMQAYQTPLAQEGQPAPPGVKTYPSLAERAKAAGALFADVANKYGMTPDGRNALYFEGLTQIEAGQNQQAEDTLKKVSSSWDSNLAGLAKFALAQLYRDSGRNDQAITIYQQLMKKPTTTVPAGLAQLQLADTYQAEGNNTKAKELLADLKDKDAKGPAGAIAAEQLNPSPAAQAGLPPQ
jgi:tetratricopeptide (TPR) repeat protein